MGAAMEREFWQARWDEGHIGFHQDDINPYLPRYWPQLGVAAGGTVFVPLCGKSKDMLWLRSQGHSVLGVEIVPRAVEAFFAEHALAATTHRQDDFTVWQGDRIKIFCGDFFNLAASDMTGVGAVYDRAALIALPPALRVAYAQHLHAILPRDTVILLVTVDYPQAEMQGPPFAVAAAEVDALYNAYSTIEPLCAEDVLAANPRFRDRGLTRLEERVCVLRRR